MNAPPAPGLTGPTGLRVLSLITAAALAVDAYVHADLAARYDPISASLSQGDLFRIEAAAASLGALLILLRPASRLLWAYAALVLTSALGAILLYRYVDVGALGPLPNMYEPVWYREKGYAAVAEGIGTAAALAGLTLAIHHRHVARHRH
ncbi:hypothetical protein [Kitasatospora sp. MAP12-44]|uniref:hypothetical protein n=1 Tax=Kitasatospora sp. MAP12-44 TaxID=3035099 RepID=UPI002473BEC8|nr:hypothetical protein [Kitasatospora sp. MAP12-44]